MEEAWGLVVVSRPQVPSDLKRRLKEEAGYRCAVPNCRDTGPFDFEHIENWSKVEEHRFDNMVLLCVKCHARTWRKEGGTISKSSVRNYKRNLAIISGRYSLYEMRLIEVLWSQGNPSIHEAIQIPMTDRLHFKGLEDDRLINIQNPQGGVMVMGMNISPLFVALSSEGVQFVSDYFSARPLN